MDPFTALADPLRRDLVSRLATGPTRVVDLAAMYPVTRPAVSRHLRLLLDSGVVEVEDRGRERLYRLAEDGLAPVRSYLAGLERAPVGEAALDALDLEVRRVVRERRTPGAPGVHDETEETA